MIFVNLFIKLLHIWVNMEINEGENFISLLKNEFDILKALEEQLKLKILNLKTNINSDIGYESENGYITKLILTNLRLEFIPDIIQDLNMLEYLFLNDNCLRSIPNWINKLSKLRFLNIIHNEITSLPNEICDLLSLTNLWCSDNKLIGFPENIGNLSNLRFLGISENPLESIPNSLMKLNATITFMNVPITLLPKIAAVWKNNPNISHFYQKQLIQSWKEEEYKGIFWNQFQNKNEKINQISVFGIKTGSGFGFELRCNDILISSIKHVIREDLIILKDRNETYLKFTLILKNADLIIPLIEKIMISIETDRGDRYTIQFSDFKFKIIDKNSKIDRSRDYLGNFMNEVLYDEVIAKIDSEYRNDPIAHIKFTNIEIFYTKQLTPKNDNSFINLEKIIDKNFKLIFQRLEINQIDNEIEKQRNINEFIQQKYNDLTKLWRPPLLLNISIKMGNGIGSWLGKFIDYVAAGVIVLSSIPNLLQFILSLRIENGILIQIEIPLIWELITYLPLAFVFVWLLIKFIKNQKTKKNETKE